MEINVRQIHTRFTQHNTYGDCGAELKVDLKDFLIQRTSEFKYNTAAF